MPIQFDKFEQGKIDLLKSSLEAAAQKDPNKECPPYEIFVDSLKAVRRATDPKLFDGYEKYLTEGTSTVKIVIYASDKTNRNEQYVFSLKAQNREEAVDLGLMGLPFKSFSNRDVTAWRQRKQQKTAEGAEIQGLKREITELNNEIEELETRNDELEAQLKEAEDKAGTINGINIPKMLAQGASELIKMGVKNNPSLSGLAGFFGADDKAIEQKSEPAQESEVSFKKQASPQEGIVLTEQEKHLLAFFKQMERYFSPEEMEQLITVIDLISKDKTQLPVVLELLQEEPGEEDK